MMNSGTEQTPQTVRIDLTLPNAQLILNALTERPHREVAQLIPDLMTQIQAQLKLKPGLRSAPPASRFFPGQLMQRGKELWQATRATDDEPFEGENSPWMKVLSDLRGKVVVSGMGAKKEA